MGIHHTIAKGAAKVGIVITANDESVSAHHIERNLQATYSFEGVDEQSEQNEIARGVWNDVVNAIAYMDEHSGVRIAFDDGDWIAYPAGTLPEDMTSNEIARDPNLDDLFETLAEQIEDEGVDDDDEPEITGSVVPDKYKKLYAEQGHPTNCGDWYADTIARFCRVMDEKGKEVIDIDRLCDIATANAVTPERYGKLGIETNGWQGRYRMTVGNMMRPRIAEKGFMFVPEGCGVDADQEIAAPADFCAKHMPKAKKAKAQVAADVKKVGAPSGKKSAKSKAKETQARDGVAVATAAIKSARAKGNR